jgi:hypothetical protein
MGQVRPAENAVCDFSPIRVRQSNAVRAHVCTELNAVHPANVDDKFSGALKHRRLLTFWLPHQLNIGNLYFSWETGSPPIGTDARVGFESSS